MRSKGSGRVTDGASSVGDISPLLEKVEEESGLGVEDEQAVPWRTGNKVKF